MNDKLLVKKEEKELYDFVKFCAKLAGQSYYVLVKKGNSLGFYTNGYGVVLQMKNDILDDVIIDCADGKYAICKNLDNTFTLIFKEPYHGYLMDELNNQLKDAKLVCRVSENDEYKIHEICKNVLIKDSYIPILSQYGSIDIYKTDNHIIISNSQTSQVYNVLNITKIIIGFDFKGKE